MPKYGKNPAAGLEPWPCIVCGTVFQPYRSHQIACSRACRDKSKELSPLRVERSLTCKVCGVEFVAMWSGIGRQPSCAVCTEQFARGKKDRMNASRRPGGHLEAVSKARTKKYNLYRYNMTEAELAAMTAAQDNRCAICGDPPNPGTGPSTQRLHIDHDHRTGVNRALLCLNCNRGLGYFKDDPELLNAAAAYLRSFALS